MFKGLGSVVLVLMLVSCGAPRPRPSAPQAPARPATPQVPSGVHAYRVDTEQSELRVLVYRAGPMARFGHNHVMVNRALKGWVNIENAQTASAFSLTIPVADFVVDDAQSRGEEGPDFPGEIPDDAKSGTLHNMLSAALLDAAEYPVIAVDSVGVAGTQGELTATLTIRVAGHESKIDAPFTLESDPQRLSATGSLELRQSAIGLTPFSLTLGALQVQDMVQLKFKIVALASSSSR